MFALTKEQSEKLNEWAKALKNGPTGAIGGRFTYSFTPTSLGTIVKVKCGLTNEEVDLTDYQDW